MSRATIGRATGLDWISTFVLKATGDLALDLWERRLTLDQVEERLAASTRISYGQIVEALRPLCERGYLIADDSPLNPQIVVQLTTDGLEEYCARFVREYRRIGPDVLKLVCQDSSFDVVALADRSGRPPLLVEHILEIAERNGLLRLTRTGYSIVVRDVRPQLRRWLSGAA